MIYKAIEIDNRYKEPYNNLIKIRRMLMDKAIRQKKLDKAIENYTKMIIGKSYWDR